LIFIFLDSSSDPILQGVLIRLVYQFKYSLFNMLNTERLREERVKERIVLEMIFEKGIKIYDRR